MGGGRRTAENPHERGVRVDDDRDASRSRIDDARFGRRPHFEGVSALGERFSGPATTGFFFGGAAGFEGSRVEPAFEPRFWVIRFVGKDGVRQVGPAGGAEGDPGVGRGRRPAGRRGQGEQGAKQDGDEGRRKSSKRIHHEAKVQRARGPDGDKIDRERVRSRRDREDTKVVNMASATKTRQASGLSPRGSRLYSEGGD